MKKNKKKKSGPIFILDTFLKISFLGVLIVIGYFTYIFFTSPTLDVENMVRPNDSYVFDKNDKYVGTISRKKENQINITYNDLNQSLINSLVGTEDATFFTHQGVDFLSTIDATIQTMLGRNKGGGSSITQQVLGWSHLDRNERSINRKAKEILLSLRAETQINKEEIMELYFNYFFYGKNNIHGVERASEYFFSNSAYNLDFVQSAIMTGTLNSPSYFNPLGYFDTEQNKYINNSNERLQDVLISSKNQGYLKKDEYFLLQQVRVENTVKFNKITLNNQFKSYIDLVRKEMEEKYQVDLTQTSMNIYTNMDIKAQKQADSIVSGKAVKLPEKDMNFGFVMTKTETGAIVAVGGGKQYKEGGELLLNNASELKQQPGSAFKPIIAYSPTFEFLQWGNRAPISNKAMKYPGTNISIRNYDGTSGGILTMDAALATSRNLTAVRAMEAVVNKVDFTGLNEYLTRLGFSFEDDELAYAYALGSTRTGVSPVEMNGAYQAFGNGGKYIEPWTIRYYVNQDDNTKVTNPTKPVQAIDERTAFMMSTTLETATKASRLVGPANFYGTPYAGKTGTSNWGPEGAQYGIPNLAPKDSWFSGFTSEYTLSVWSGFDPKGVKKGKYPAWAAQHDYAAAIWGSMMRKMKTGKETSYLNAKVPDGIVKSSFDPKTPAPFKFSSYGKSAVGYFYKENLPKGYAKPNFEDSDFTITISFKNNVLNAKFKTFDKVDGITYNLKVNGQLITSQSPLISTPIEAAQDIPISITAFYTYEGKQKGKMKACILNNKLTSKCD